MQTEERLAPPGEPRHRRLRQDRRPRRRAVATAVAVLVAVVAIAVATRDRGGRVATVTSTVPPTATSTTGAPPATAGVTTTAPPATAAPTTVPSSQPAADRSAAIWPAPGSGLVFTDPVAAARDFATAFLGFDEPVVGAFRRADARSGDVAVRPQADGPVTAVVVRQLDGSSWDVTGATTAQIEVTAPAPGATVGAPVAVSGQAFTFEGHVAVEVREDGRLAPAGTGYVTGGGDEMRPFGGSVSAAPGRGGLGAVVFLTRSAKDGRVWEAAAVRVRLRAGALDTAACGAYRSPRYGLAPGAMEVKAFFSCDAGTGGPYPAYRAVPRSPSVLRASLEALLAGPDATERRASLGSSFSQETAPLLRSVTLSGGHAVVDFGDLAAVIPNASASAGSERLLSQLDATVFQFSSVTSVEYRLEGSCQDFSEWVQFGGCPTRTRAEVRPP